MFNSHKRQITAVYLCRLVTQFFVVFSCFLFQRLQETISRLPRTLSDALTDKHTKTEIQNAHSTDVLQTANWLPLKYLKSTTVQRHNPGSLYPLKDEQSSIYRPFLLQRHTTNQITFSHYVSVEQSIRAISANHSLISDRWETSAVFTSHSKRSGEHTIHSHFKRVCTISPGAVARPTSLKQMN